MIFEACLLGFIVEVWQPIWILLETEFVSLMIGWPLPGARYQKK